MNQSSIAESELSRTREQSSRFEREQRLRAQLELLHRSAVLLRTELDLDSLLQQIIDLARELAQAQYGALALHTAAKSSSRFFVSGLDAAAIEKMGQPPQLHGLLGALAREGKTVRLRNVASHPQAVGFPENHPFMTSFLGVPIQSRGEIIASIYLTNRQAETPRGVAGTGDVVEFSEDDAHLLEMLAAHAGIAIDSARILQRQQLLARLSREVTSSLDLDDILGLVMRHLRPEIDFREGSIALINPQNELYFAASDPPSRHEVLDVRIPLGSGARGWVAANAKPFYSPDLDAEPEVHLAYRDPISPYVHSFLAVPLVSRKRVIGVLGIDSTAKNAFTGDQRELLEVVAAQVAGSLENARLFRELRTSAAALHESEERYRDLIEDVDDLVYAHDLTGRILAVNRKCEALVGYSRQELLGMNIEALVPPEFLEEVYQGLEQLMNAGVASGPLHLRTKDGRIVNGEVRATLIMRDGAPYGVRGIMRDLTAVRELEERMMRTERLATLGRIAASVSHELRNPLGAISNASYFLKMQLAQASDLKVRRHLDIIERQIKIANRIISDLLNFSRTPNLDLESFALAPLCVEALAAFTIPDFIRVELQVEPELMVLADRQSLSQVLQNLISNAVQAMPEGGKLTVRAQEVKRQGALWLEISVADTGGGIAREDQGRIFEPLFTTRARGIGLGLTICKSIVQAHGGTIWVESPITQVDDARQNEDMQDGAGTIFYIDLPAAQPQLQARSVESSATT